MDDNHIEMGDSYGFNPKEKLIKKDAFKTKIDVDLFTNPYLSELNNICVKLTLVSKGEDEKNIIALVDYEAILKSGIKYKPSEMAAILFGLTIIALKVLSDEIEEKCGHFYFFPEPSYEDAARWISQNFPPN